jgi:hypothetical protein
MTAFRNGLCRFEIKEFLGTNDREESMTMTIRKSSPRHKITSEVDHSAPAATSFRFGQRGPNGRPRQSGVAGSHSA